MMKTRLLRRVRARFKLLKDSEGHWRLLNLWHKHIEYGVFFDWRSSVKQSYIRHMVRETVGEKKFNQMIKNHLNRKARNERLRAFNEVLKGEV